MTDLKELEKLGSTAVKRLRLSKLKKGHPFMINSNSLPTNQCYIEYPDGNIVLATLSKSSMDFTVIRNLSNSEGKNLLRNFSI